MFFKNIFFLGCCHYQACQSETCAFWMHRDTIESECEPNPNRTPPAGSELEWVAESDKWASVVLEERFGVENLGDITKIQDPPTVDVTSRIIWMLAKWGFTWQRNIVFFATRVPFAFL